MFYSSTGHFLTQVLVVAVVLTSLYTKLFLAGAGLQAAATAAAASDDRAVRDVAHTLYFSGVFKSLPRPPAPRLQGKDSFRPDRYRTVFAQQLLSAYLLGIVGGFFSTACERGFRVAGAQLSYTVLRGGLLFYGFLLQTKVDVFPETSISNGILF